MLFILCLRCFYRTSSVALALVFSVRHFADLSVRVEPLEGLSSTMRQIELELRIKKTAKLCLEAIATRLEAIAIRLEAFAIR